MKSKNMLNKYQKYVISGFINTKSCVKNIHEISKVKKINMRLLGNNHKSLSTLVTLLYTWTGNIPKKIQKRNIRTKKLEVVGASASGDIELLNTIIYLILIEATNYRGIKSIKKEKAIQIALPNLENSAEVIKHADSGNMVINEYSHNGNINIKFTKNKRENIFILKSLKLPIRQ